MNVRRVYEDLVNYENEKLLFENKVIDALQFLKNSAKKLRYAEIELNALTFVNDKIKESYDQWNKEFFDNEKINFFPITIFSNYHSGIFWY